MNAVMTMMKNQWTTLIGLAAGIAYYMQSVGTSFPSNKSEWSKFVYGLLIVLLGFASKDATTGSKPTDTKP